MSMRLAALELKDIVWALLLDFPFFDFQTWNCDVGLGGAL